MTVNMHSEVTAGDLLLEARTKYSESNRSDVFESYFRLESSFMKLLCLKGPYSLMVDNSLHDSLLKKDQGDIHKARYVATCLFFGFLSQHYRHEIEIHIPPTMLYEALGKASSVSPDDYDHILAQFNSTYEPFGFPVSLGELRDARTASEALGRIAHDASVISDAYNRIIKNADWSIDLQDEERLLAPTFPAQIGFPKLKLRYFEEHSVRSIMTNIICDKIVANQRDDRTRRAFQKGSREFGRIVKAKKGVLKGIGDLELIVAIDLTRQHWSKQKRSFGVLTFDEGLFHVYHRASMIVDSDTVQGGDKEGARRVAIKIFSEWPAESKEHEEVMKRHEERCLRYLEKVAEIFQGHLPEG